MLGKNTNPFRLSFSIGNFLEDEPIKLYDLIFEHTLYCAIEPARRAEYAEAVDKNLKPGGLFLTIHFLFPLSEEGPPFGASTGDPGSIQPIF